MSKNINNHSGSEIMESTKVEQDMNISSSNESSKSKDKKNQINQ